MNEQNEQYVGINREGTSFDRIGYAIRDVEDIRRKKEPTFAVRENHRNHILDSRLSMVDISPGDEVFRKQPQALSDQPY